MLKQFSDWLYTITTGWLTILAVIVFILFSALVLPGQSRSAPQTEAGTPDLSFYYPAQELYHMAEALGQAGREAYIRARFTFDLVWPLVYTFLLVTTISWVYQRVVAAESPWRLINLLPVLGMCGDYLENISTSLVMWRYPLSTFVLDWMAGVFTALKWLLIAGSFAGLLAGLILLIFQIITWDRGVEPE
jgi:hypothetical protein